MKIGIIGGSGFDDMEGFTGAELRRVVTPFGNPSGDYLAGQIGGRDVLFLSRHGRGHRLLPSEIPHQANIYGFKTLGVECVVSVSAVGSLKENLRPRDIVLPDQYFDRTKQAARHTFFGDGVVAHVAFADPSCAALRELIAASARRVLERAAPASDVRVHEGGTYVCMEGPAFSTRAESIVHRGFGFDVVGMTSLPEAKLCREAEICYQGVAMVTDYDCWHRSEASVSVEMVVGHLAANTRLAKDIVRDLVASVPEVMPCECRSALGNAILTGRSVIPQETKRKLGPILARYV